MSGILPEYNIVLVHILDSLLMLPALVMCISLLLSCPSWKEEFLKNLPIIGNHRSSRIGNYDFRQKKSVVSESEVLLTRYILFSVAMIVSFYNSSDLLWLPVYSINDRIHESSFYVILGCFQIVIYCFTGYVIIKTCSIFLRIKLFHENINILMTWFLCQWFEAILAKCVIIPYQTGMIQIGQDPRKTYFNWWTDNRTEMLIVKDKNEIWSLYVSSCFMWHYIWSVMFGPVVVGVERLCATYYIQDYENSRRRQIPIILILVTNLITIPYAYLVINDQIPFMIAYGQCVMNAAIVFFGYLIGFRINVIWRDRMDSDQSRYSLARKFQVEENIRYLLSRVGCVYHMDILLVILERCFYKRDSNNTSIPETFIV
ncbi:hypothetical protein L3Y34_019033 [Caenorhabditis briggsae]|uniref:Uncharacterized protein n=1 Tax=Caenorhabditis briggsae TaxID=6238 RepID=A0AAE9IVL5_CAEBR|nr:hypothetical protein L3Y34_019033 [Caenorhabditis briggsae]